MTSSAFLLVAGWPAVVGFDLYISRAVGFASSFPFFASCFVFFVS